MVSSDRGANVDPVLRMARLVREIAAELARLEAERDAIDAKIATVLQVATAHGFDRATIRAVARSLKGDPAPQSASLQELYLVAMKVGG